jgi:galactonate dehydratase
MQRRNFFGAAAAGAAASLASGCAPAPAPDRNALAVKITGVEIFTIAVNDRGPWVVIRLQTDAGVTGIGDPSHSGPNDPAIAKVKEYVERLKGRSVFDIEWLRGQAFPEYPQGRRAVSCAVSGVEQAMYDIQGKLLGVPCWALFGGKLRDEVRNYANINRSTDVRTPEGFAELAKSAVEHGFDAIKMASFDGMPRNGTPAEIEAHTQLGIDCVQAVRDVIGPDRDLLVDAHSNFDLKRGMDLLKRLEPLKLFWLEEITRPLEDWAALTKAAPMTTAGGESLFGTKEFWPYLKGEACHVMMPDVKYCGGMFELKKIAAMTEAAGDNLTVAPHGPASPVGNMAAAHVCVTLPNFLILEYSHGDALGWRADMVTPAEPLGKGGMLRVPDTPGLGYELNEETVRERLVG